MKNTIEARLPYPLLALIVLAAFYGIYFGKMLAQRRRGIQTRQIGRRKEKGVYRVEMLMSVATRCAEWNYLFGAVLLRLAETEKALIYLSVAAHQNPECRKYIRALNEARVSRGGAMRRFVRFARRG